MTFPDGAIRLRALRKDDLPTLYAWYQDPQTVRSLGANFRYRSEAEVVDNMGRWLVSSESEVRLAIEHGPAHQLVGMVSLQEIDALNRSASFHLVLGEAEARGKGLGVLATRAMLKHAFGDLGLQRVGLQVLDDNHAARALYAKAGFVVEGELREAVFKDGQRHGLVLMGILAGEFRDA
ncbi:MAG: GNAT family N-acetyltransferase [Caulobacterales bacterium]|jgi:RimJ/RimL family protein N-acetyltransferase